MKELENLIEKHGQKKLLFMIEAQQTSKILFVRMTNSSNPFRKLAFTIKDYNPNHKVYLKPVEHLDHSISELRYYVSDLNNLIRNGIVDVYVKA